MRIQFLSAVIIRSSQATVLAEFYRRLGLELVASTHAGPGSLHFECDLGDVHFALHQADTASANSSSFKIAFAVKNLDDVLATLRSRAGLAPSTIIDRGFARSAALVDPDGNLVELTELSRPWLEYLAGRPSAQRDVVAWALN